MDSKADIKKRMIAAAAKSWGINVREMGKVDPLIPLLIDACASEIERVSSSIEDARSTMGEKLIELLTPESLLSPFPARAIIYAQPFDGSFVLNPNHHFYTSRENPYNEDGLPIDLFFTPTVSQTLINGELKYLATKNTIYSFETPFEKKELCRSISGKTIPTNEVWIGLNMNKNVDSLDEMTFYFDLGYATEYESRLFYHALADSEWHLGDQLFTHRTGFESNLQADIQNKFDLPLSVFNRARTVSKHIAAYYYNKFITLLDKKGASKNFREEMKVYPAFFEEVFSQEDLEENMVGKCIWFRVVFKEHIPEKLYDQISCSINCVPVMNRKLEHFYVNGREHIKQLNAEDHEQYFDLKSVHCDRGLKVIFEKPKSGDLENKALVNLRNDNIGRFNKRNALETLRNFNMVFYEEYAAFSKVKGLEHDQLDNLNKAIRPFENVFEEMYGASSNDMPYIMVKTEKENETLDVDVHYWLTNGALANQLRQGEPLRFDSAELVRDSIFMVTDAEGGADRQGTEELVDEFRYALLTNDKIATIEDVKALCRMQFGDYLESVEAAQSVETASRSGSGLRRVIDVRIRLKQYEDIPHKKLEFLKKDLELQLKEKSLNAMPFRVSVE